MLLNLDQVRDLLATLDGKEPTIAPGTTAQYRRGDKSWQTLNKAAVGLANVDNTSDANKPVSTATQTALNGKQAASAVLAALALLTMANNAGKTIVVNSTGDGFTLVNPAAGSAVENYTTPMAYGAIGDGVANDTAAVQAALNSGKKVDGLGKTYALSAQVSPTNFKGLRNAGLKWLNTTEMTVQGRALLYITNQGDWIVEGCTFDMGTVEDIGASGAPDNARAGLKVYNGNNGSFCERVWVINNRVLGHGAGTGLEIRNVKNAVVGYNFVTDRYVAGAGINNDCQNGIQVADSQDVKIIGNTVSGLYMRVSGSLVKKWSRGMCFASLHHSTITGNTISYVDQAMDNSGGPDFNGTVNGGGNRGNSITANVIHDVGTWGIKLANSCRDMVVSANNISLFGYAGIVCSGSATGTSQDQMVQRLLIEGNTIWDPTGEYTATQCNGILLLANGVDTNYPAHITVRGNNVYDSSGGGHMQYAYYSQVPQGMGNLWELNRGFNYTAAIYGGTISSNDWKTL